MFITIMCLLSPNYEATRLIAFCLLLYEIYGFYFISLLPIHAVKVDVPRPICMIIVCSVF